MGPRHLAATAELGGALFSRGTQDDLYAVLCRWLRADGNNGRVVTYVNPHVFNVAKRYDAVRELLRTADMVGVDGIGFALAVRWLTGHLQTRTVMTPLFDRILATDTLPPLRAALIGGVPTVMERGVAAINRASRNIRVVASCRGYRSDEQYLRFLREHATIDVVLVAMGSPRSEELIAYVRDLYPTKVFWNIGGGTLHFYAGTRKRVPERWSQMGLQWLWRIAHEPRIAPRYFVGIPRFVTSLVRYRVQQARRLK